MVSGNGYATTARLLVLGDKQVGKSAAIVRYTTGRYIQEYGTATGRWLYKHQLAPAEGDSGAQSVELLEQKDLKIFDSSNLFANDNSSLQTANQSLASRVAMDQQQASELHEKQELMSKLHWANAYVVIYAINEVSSFNKAIKYLNLIANNINNTNSSRSPSSTSSCSSSSSSSGSSSACDHNHQLDHLHFIQLTSSSARRAANHSTSNSSSALLAAQTAATCAHSSQRRPILLLGNKRDLERHGRQVSSSDGRLLAMRHQSMFAEVSIAETHKLIELHLATLIDHIDAASLHVDQQQQQPIRAEINHWRPSIEMALVQTNVNAAAPIWASLIKSKSTATSPLPINGAKIVKSCAVGGQVAQSAQLGLAKGAKTAHCLTKQPSSLHPSTNHRYETLKSSFKRASMAIVSSKALAMGHSTNSNSISNNNKPSDQQRQSITSQSDRDSILGDLSNLSQCETIGEHQAISSSNTSGRGHRSWFKSHLARNSRRPEAATSTKTSSICSLENGNVKAAGSQLSLATNEGERPTGGRRLLFRYRNRRQTVAFNPIEAAETNSLKSNNSSGPETGKSLGGVALRQEQMRQIDIARGGKYNSARCSSNRSSSSLSTDVSYPSGSLVARKEASITNSSRQPTRRGSSSRASTPDASYEDSGDELVDQRTLRGHPRAAPKSSSLSSSSSSSAATPKESVKRRYQLVKSVQSTLANITMSSRSSNVANTATKRSFCNSLFKHQPTVEAKRVDDAPPPVLVAKTEHIRTRPTLVGYCK